MQMSRTILWHLTYLHRTAQIKLLNFYTLQNNVASVNHLFQMTPSCLNGDNWHIQQYKQQRLKRTGTLPGISSLIQLIIVSTIELLPGDRYLTVFIDRNTTAQGLEQECWVLDCIKFCCYFRRDSFPSFYCL